MRDFMDELQRRLVELGCPDGKRRRLVQEVADHREDLKQAALAEGSGEADAEACASAGLGNPHELAERLVMVLRRSSWWGRHSIISFCVLPLLAFPVLWMLFLCLCLIPEFGLASSWYGKNIHPAFDNPVTFHHWSAAFYCADYIAVALTTLVFCWLARRSAVSLAWMLTACVICSLCASFTHSVIKPHSFIVGLTRTPQWLRAAIPLLVGWAIYAIEKRSRKGSAPFKQTAGARNQGA